MLHAIDPGSLVHRVVTISALAESLDHVRYPIALVDATFLVYHCAATLLFIVVLVADVHVARRVRLNASAHVITVLPFSYVDASVCKDTLAKAMICIVEEVPRVA